MNISLQQFILYLSSKTNQLLTQAWIFKQSCVFLLVLTRQSTRTIISEVPLISCTVRLSVVSVGAWLTWVRCRFGRQLSPCGVSAGTRRLRSERFDPPCRILLLLLLLLEMSQIFFFQWRATDHATLLTLDKWALSVRQKEPTRLFFVWSFLLCHFVKLVKLPRSKLCKLRHKYPEVSAK